MSDQPNLLVRRAKPMFWWDARNLNHPLDDNAFAVAFCNHVFETTNDVSVRQVRVRVHRFIRNFMAPELMKALAEYRKIYK